MAALEVCLAAVSLLCVAWRVLLVPGGGCFSPWPFPLHEELLKDFQTECNEYPGLAWFRK